MPSPFRSRKARTSQPGNGKLAAYEPLESEMCSWLPNSKRLLGSAYRLDAHRTAPDAGSEARAIASRTGEHNHGTHLERSGGREQRDHATAVMRTQHGWCPETRPSCFTTDSPRALTTPPRQDPTRARAAPVVVGGRDERRGDAGRREGGVGRRGRRSEEAAAAAVAWVRHQAGARCSAAVCPWPMLPGATTSRWPDRCAQDCYGARPELVLELASSETPQPIAAHVTTSTWSPNTWKIAL